MLRIFFSSFFIIAIGMMCGFVVHLLLARVLPMAEYGTYNFIFSLSLILSIFSLAGFQNSVVRFIPSFLQEKNSARKIHDLVSFSTLFTLIASLVSGIGVYAILYFLGFTEKYPEETFLIGALLVPLMALMRLHAGFLRGFRKSAESVFYETTFREAGFLILILIAFLAGYFFESAFIALITVGFVFGLGMTISWFHAQKVLPAKDKKPGENKNRRELLKVSFPMMFIIFAQRFLRRSDIIILGLMVHPFLVGAYALAAQFSEVSSISQKVVQAVFSPRAAELYKAKDIQSLRNSYYKMLLYSASVTAIIALVIGLTASSIIPFFGAAYMEGYHALLILLVGQFIAVCFGPASALLIMSEYETAAMKITAVAAMSNIIFNTVAIYYFGLEGAAFTTAFFFIARNFASYVFVLRKGLLNPS